MPSSASCSIRLCSQYVACDLLVFDALQHQVVQGAGDFLRDRRHEGLRIDLELCEPAGALEDFSKRVPGQFRLFLQEGENVRQHLDGFRFADARRDLLVSRYARIGDIHLHNGGGDARRLDRLDSA